MAMACFHAIDRGLEYKSHSGNPAPVHPAWSRIRAWSLHFIFLCMSNDNSESSLGSRFNLTDIMTTMAACLRNFFEFKKSYYRIVSASISFRDRKYLAYLSQGMIVAHKDKVSYLISDFMKKFSVTTQASLAIQADFHSNPLFPDFSIKRIADIVREVGEIKPLFIEVHLRPHDSWGLVRIFAPGGVDQFHIFPPQWIISSS
ncbi:uncharacterized protein ARMOST_20407 [Armillaria ostoyae]|uniref:Uncharacterized protein n=1 Tax=Armillaria ostoyae TaxID=47428 RepID=A0A284S787_ARMOS|nr:uncharacterized protein ARMOST_20407 [Armillaria ostoyae]